jgi:hypothetical protein
MADKGLCLHFFAKNKKGYYLTMEDSQQSLKWLEVSTTFSEIQLEDAGCILEKN